MQKITPFLWFDDKAEGAANYYVSIFKNSKILGISHYGDGAPRPKGSVLVVDFQLDGQKFLASNRGDWGGGDYKDVMAGVEARTSPSESWF